MEDLKAIYGFPWTVNSVEAKEPNNIPTEK
jgi:hypothetical protein